MVPAGLPGPFLLQYGMEPESVYSNTRAAFNGIERPSMRMPTFRKATARGRQGNYGFMESAIIRSHWLERLGIAPSGDPPQTFMTCFLAMF